MRSFRSRRRRSTFKKALALRNSQSPNADSSSAPSGKPSQECVLVLRQPQPVSIHHSDHGVQYACHAHTDLLKQHELRINMSRKANPWDNAQAESSRPCSIKRKSICQTSTRSKRHRSTCPTSPNRSTTGNGCTQPSVICPPLTSNSNKINNQYPSSLTMPTVQLLGCTPD